MRKADFWQSGPKGCVRCVLCPHRCAIAPGAHGLCRARANRDGEMEAQSYGCIASAALDPVEKNPLARFHPGAFLLSIGSYGCNMRCGYCQNAEISQSGDARYRTAAPEEVVRDALQLTGGGNIGIAYTYNEPLVGYEFVADCCRLAAKNGLRNVLVTNGFVCEEPLAALLPYIHAANIDLKCIRPEGYRALGGVLADVQRTIEMCAQRCHVEVTTLAVPGLSDDVQQMRQLSQWLAGVCPDIPLHVSRYFPRHLWRDVPAIPVDTIYRLADEARKSLRFVYTGNC